MRIIYNLSANTSGAGTRNLVGVSPNFPKKRKITIDNPAKVC